MNKTDCPECAEDAVMRELFARPDAYIVAAKAEAAKRTITGFQFDFEAPGQANNANQTMWLDTLRFHEVFGAALAPQGVLTSVATMCTANVTGNASAENPTHFCGNGQFVRYSYPGLLPNDSVYTCVGPLQCIGYSGHHGSNEGVSARSAFYLNGNLQHRLGHRVKSG